MITVNLQWQFGTAGFAFAQLQLNPLVDKDNYLIDLSTVLTGSSDKPIRARSVEIALTNAQDLISASSCTILLDGHSVVFSGSTRFNVDTIRTMQILNAPGIAQITLRFYSVLLFDAAVQSSQQTGPSSESAGLVTYQTFITNDFAGGWKWDASGNAPFNNGANVTIPIKLRDPNPYRANNFRFYGGVVKNDILQGGSFIPGICYPWGQVGGYDFAAFAMQWGQSAGSCTLPFPDNYYFDAFADSSVVPDSFGLSNNLPGLSMRYNHASKYGTYVQSHAHYRFPIDCFADSSSIAWDTAFVLQGAIAHYYYITGDPRYTSQNLTKYRYFVPELIPRGEIWVCCKPLRPPSALDFSLHAVQVGLHVN